MAVSIDWPTKVITVPKADTTLVDIGPPEIRSLDLNQFRKDLNALQAGEEGMPEETTHVHTAPVTIGGTTLARLIEIINGYTVTFEAGTYAVNLEGANSNVGDVLNLTSTSIRASNSAGLIEFTGQPAKGKPLNAFVFTLEDSNGVPLTGLSPTATRSLDGASFAATANSPTEVAFGYYKIDLAGADMDGEVVALRFVATGAADRQVVIVTAA